MSDGSRAITEHDRARICDATIALLARQGVAGVTYRAVDRVINRPAGTTRSMFPTQLELLQAAGERLALLDGLEAADFRANTAGIAAVLDRSLSDARRDRLLARFELYLHSARTPEFKTMHWAREMFVAGAEAHLRVASAKAPQLAAAGVIALIEGLLIHSFVAPSLPRRDRSLLIRRMLSGLFEETLPENAERL